jgi:hypothetical protein
MPSLRRLAVAWPSVLLVVFTRDPLDGDIAEGRLPDVRAGVAIPERRVGWMILRPSARKRASICADCGCRSAAAGHHNCSREQGACRRCLVTLGVLLAPVSEGHPVGGDRVVAIPRSSRQSRPDNVPSARVRRSRAPIAQREAGRAAGPAGLGVVPGASLGQRISFVERRYPAARRAAAWCKAVRDRLNLISPPFETSEGHRSRRTPSEVFGRHALDVPIRDE